MADEVKTSESLDRMRSVFAQHLVVFIWFNVLLVIGASWWLDTLSVSAVSGSALLLG